MLWLHHIFICSLVGGHLGCFYLFLFVFFATLGLCCCSRPFSSCNKQGLLSSCSARAPHCSGLSRFRAPVRTVARRSVVAAHGLCCPWACCPSETSWTRDRTRVLGIGRRFPKHWTSREASFPPFDSCEQCCCEHGLRVLVLVPAFSSYLGLELPGRSTMFDFLRKYLFVYLAVPGLNCGTQTLSCSMWDIVPWQRIELGPPALGMQSLSHWTTREVPMFDLMRNH